ncbi:MAG: protein-disulfide reductase DsbD N-terminal domain-containing protein [Acidobacteriota bacterium]|nr:protein-disulfide reductase DsbD N-terminal domain-containing protein [Acidobacteriota bacterium]
MKILKLRKSFLTLLFATAIVAVATNSTLFAQSPPNINVNGYVVGDNVRRGRSAKAVVEMDIPGGFHVHSNRPLEKFLIATQLKVEAPAGVRVSAVSYPRAILRSLKFSKNRVAVFEGRATMRFNVTVPANFGSNSAQLKATLRYQSCNDELCFPPQSKEVWIQVKVN